MTVRSWPEVRLRFTGMLNPSKSELSGLARDTEVTFLPMDAIGDDGSIRLDAIRSLADVEQGYTYFRDGDVAVAKITPCFENGKGALMSGLLGGIGFGTTELIVVRPDHHRITGPFLQWLFTSPHFRKAAEAAMYGAGGQKRVPDDFVRDFPVLLPTLKEQSAIAAFLERETGKIDALVAEQERLIALLKEKRQAVISHAVTKGLNPKAPMKDSEVPWLGEVPAHWEIKRLGRVCEFTSGKAHEPFFDEDGEYLCVTARFISTNGRSARRCSKNLSPARQGDILMVMSDLPNGRALARTYKTSNSGILAVNQRVCIISLYQGNPAFFDYQLDRNPGLLQHDDGINQTHLSNSDFTSLLLLVPPSEEQNHIAEGLDATTARLDILSDDATRAITLLRERRAALISAAVTGKIDVRDTAAQTSPQAA